MSRVSGAGLLKGQPGSPQAWAPREPDLAQGKEVVVPTVHPSSLALDFASASEATSGNLSEMTFANTPEVALISTSKTGVPPDKATLAKAGEHRDPYLYPRREEQSSAGQARPFAPSDHGLGQRRERNRGGNGNGSWGGGRFIDCLPLWSQRWRGGCPGSRL